MPFCCDKCNRPFRDNYDLKRHKARKIPCVSQPKVETHNDASGNTYNINNINVNYVFVLGEESVTQVDIH